MSKLKSSLYKQHIIDHYKNPRNAGPLSSPTNRSKSVNRSCGDEISLELKIEDNKIVDIGYQVSGCAICVASISMLSEKVLGKTLDEVNSIDDLEILEQFGMEKGSGRVKCVLISKDALDKAINV